MARWIDQNEHIARGITIFVRKLRRKKGESEWDWVPAYRIKRDGHFGWVADADFLEVILSNPQHKRGRHFTHPRWWIWNDTPEGSEPTLDSVWIQLHEHERYNRDGQ